MRFCFSVPRSRAAYVGRMQRGGYGTMEITLASVSTRFTAKASIGRTVSCLYYVVLKTKIGFILMIVFFKL